MPNRTMHEQIDFPFNIPVSVTLKFSQGKACANGERVLYTTTDNRVLFLDPAQGQQIEEMNIKPGEPILITRQKQGKEPATWLIQRQADLEGQLRASLEKQAPSVGPQPEGGFKVPKLDTAPAQPKPPAKASVSSALIDEANALVDAYAAVLKRALTTHEGRIKPDEVRALLISAYIQRRQLSTVA